MTTVLLVEDDAAILETTTLALTRLGFAVRPAGDGLAGLRAFEQDRPDIALLDVMLPGLDGVSLCRRIRDTSDVPVLMISARADPIDVVLGLESGADDYVVKPFDSAVLAARLRAVLRRTGAQPASAPDVLRAGGLEIDRAAMVVRQDGAVVALTPTEYRLLLDLALNAGIVRSRDALLHDVWGYDWSGDARLVDVAVKRLRQKIGGDAIQTVRGVGYRLEQG
jgi:DNA-binding response OmpR family regulator